MIILLINPYYYFILNPGRICGSIYGIAPAKNRMVQGWFRDLQQQANEDHHREWKKRSSHSSNSAQRRGRNKMYSDEPSWPC